MDVSLLVASYDVGAAMKEEVPTQLTKVNGEVGPVCLLKGVLASRPVDTVKSFTFLWGEPMHLSAPIDLTQ